jgi:hypothetical protein
VSDGAVRPIHPHALRSAEHFLIEVDRAIGSFNDQVRGYTVIAIGNWFRCHDFSSLLTLPLKKKRLNTANAIFALRRSAAKAGVVAATSKKQINARYRNWRFLLRTLCGCTTECIGGSMSISRLALMPARIGWSLQIDARLL